MTDIKAVIAALALLAVGPALAAEAPSAVPVKHPTLKSCNRQATAKKLTGKDREQFVKDCLAAKTPGAAAPATHSQ